MTPKLLKVLLTLPAVALTVCSGGSEPPVTVQAADGHTQEREAMVRDQIRARGVRSEKVLDALRKVQRHLFVPDEMVGAAYSDRPLPIGHGQTISQPYIVGFMTDLLDVEPDHRVLEIGTGSGYQAAILAELAGEVFSIEIVEPLGNRARETLVGLGYEHVQLRIGNGYLGWPEAAPFDRVIVTAAPEEMPQALVDQLKPGGRLLAPVGPVYGAQEIIRLDKDISGKVRRRAVLPVRFVPMVRNPNESAAPRP